MSSCPEAAADADVLDCRAVLVLHGARPLGTFKRGGGVLTCGSEATVVCDVIAEGCKITGGVRIATLKLRPDTPQLYADITFRNITS
jgi:hypothetical protein